MEREPWVEAPAPAPEQTPVPEPEPKAAPETPWPAERPHQQIAAVQPVPGEGTTSEEWINTVRTNVKNAHRRFHPTNQHTIFRAPDNIRQSNIAAYEPLVVCIGPLSYLSSGCVALQNCKWRFLRCLLSRCRNGNDASRVLDRCLMELKSLDAEVRRCYSEDFPNIDSSELATMMLLDGSFILNLLLWCDVTSTHRLEPQDGSAGQDTANLTGEEQVSKSVVDIEIGGSEFFDWSVLGNRWIWQLIVYDLLKLENQIPFFVIKLIYDKLFRNADQLMVLAHNLLSDFYPNKSIQFSTMPLNEIHHLLHLFYSSIVTQQQVSQPVLAPAAVQEALVQEAGTTPKWIPNATELAMAGVKFKRKEEFDSFLDVSFENGVLEIPLLQIDDHTNPLFRNLIAFEQCFPDTNTDITIYAIFMDYIIDTANDVSLLNRKGILINMLSSNDEVASLFNQLCNQVGYDPNKNYLSNVFAKVTKYHESKLHQWRAALVRDYFSNPWVIISVLAAVLLLLLTVEQSFFAAFSYFRPP